MDNEVLTTDLENQELKLPYLIFKIDDVLYAVNGETINSIFVLDQPVTRVPMTGSHIKGIINVRGEVVPLVDVRILFGISTIDDEQERFADMLEKRKQDHLNWVDALENAVNEETEFSLTTDPHKCKFGKWYDSFEPQNTELKHVYHLIDDPHRLLHASAEHALSTTTKEDALEIVKTAKEEHVTRLLGLIDQMQTAYNVATRQMVVILQRDKTQIGIIVDEVMEVTDVEEVCSLDDVSNVRHSRFVRGVGNAEQYTRDILMIDVDQIVNISDKQSETA